MSGPFLKGSRRLSTTVLLAILTALPWPVLSATNEPAAVYEGKPDSTQKHERKPARIKISGYGFLGDLELKRAVQLLVLGGKKPDVLDANSIEDAALILGSSLRRNGYLHPSMSARLTLENGHTMTVLWQGALTTPLPRPLSVRKARFDIQKGVLFHYDHLEIQGLKAIPVKNARSFFLETGLLLRFKSYRVYTPEGLKRGIANLTEALERQGYEKPVVAVSELQQDNKTGAVQVRIQVREGPKTIVRSVREEFFFHDETAPDEIRTVFPKQPFSRLWQQDFTQSLKTNNYHRGYPDTTVEVQPLKREPDGAVVHLDLSMTIRSGPQVRLGKVEFSGQDKTRESMMRRRVRLPEDGLLDRIKAEQGRYRLAQLGIFDRVDLGYDPPDADVRNVSYSVKEGKATDINLLFGYGSYELLRGGVELERRNILGLAHHARLKLVQSFKSSSGEFVYTIPEFVGRDVDLFVNASALRREEISFLREEYGGGLGAHKFFRDLASDLSVRYNYQILNALEVEGVTATEGIPKTTVGEIITELKHDRRDNPLYPHRGYKVFSNLETATRYLGGDVNFERLEVSTSWHQRLGGGRWLHLGLTHGAAIPFGSSSNNLPFNKRFFPGGASSIRGYQEGEASPKDETGHVVGAETITLASVEFEQALTPKWALVLFSDTLGEARRIQHYPFDTVLYSAGGGFNWRTIIGPVRLEYAHNLNPRHGDPLGTLHFSLGFPF